MVQEICEALEVLGQATPLVLISKICTGWITPQSIWISAVARRRESAKLLLVGTFRPADLILSESPLKALEQDLFVRRPVAKSSSIACANPTSPNTSRRS